MLRAGALGRPRGMGRGGRWEGGLGWGTHVNPWLIHVNVWQKPLQYCKVISLQLIKINGGKKETFSFHFCSHCKACGTLIPQLGKEQQFCIGRWGLNHWTAREAPKHIFFNK